MSAILVPLSILVSWITHYGANIDHMNLQHIRNFSIIAHIDHGKSTLADRMLELTHTIPARKMREQVLDRMDLERERGITIKLAPVRMKYTISLGELDRGLAPTLTQTDADNKTDNLLLYRDITYKIRGAVFKVEKDLGLGHKEIVYHKALEIEFAKNNLFFESEKTIDIFYDSKKVGTYIPDFIVEGKILVELKALPEIGKPQEQQIWSYLKGCSYKLALLVNFGNKDVEIRRIVYDSARPAPHSSASVSVPSAQSLRGSEYTLNLIDTPGHIDFSYEVSRALKAVEGSILLVDATQGVQAQTLTTLGMARELGVKIIPAVSKIDAPLAQTEKVRAELAELLQVSKNEVLSVSGKTGEGVAELLKAIIARVPPPETSSGGGRDVRALVFDFEYSSHQGTIVYVRMLDGAIAKGSELYFVAAEERFIANEIGIFSPDKKAVKELSAGEIGYIVTGLKKPGLASVGDTITFARRPLPALPGYEKPRPVVWASLYPESQPARRSLGAGGDDFDRLKDGLAKLKLSDSSLVFEEETSGSLGRGFRSGFLGMLHLEIVTERLRREFGLNLVVTTPSINYEVTSQSGQKKMIYSPFLFPDQGAYAEAREPWALLTIITPPDYVSPIMQLLFNHEAEVGETHLFGENRISLSAKMPLRELMRNFFDRLKSASSGFASLAYEIGEMRPAEVARLDILVAGEPVPALAKVVSFRKVREEAEALVEKLYANLPRQLFEVKIQGQALGRILSSRTLKALKKDVAGYLYGGDITRKMKLREKQKKGKKKMKLLGRVNIPKEVFLKVMKE